MDKKKMSALIVDDEFYLGQILAQALQNENFEAVSVTDVDSAINKLNSESFDIVISDIYLPGKTGKDFFTYTREFYPDLPFIFMTGNPNLEMAVDLLKEGGYDYIVKPFMMANFIQKVRTTVQKSQNVKKEKSLMTGLKSLLNQRLKELQIYQDVLESTEDGLLILDTEGVIVKTNRGLQKMMHLKDGGILHQPFLEFSKERLPGIGFDEIRESLESESYWQKEIKHDGSEENSGTFNFSFFPIKNENGNTFAYAALIKDVTAQRAVENALIESLQRTNLAQEAIIFGLARLAEYRDQETGFHLERIRNYCKQLAITLSRHSKFKDIVDEVFISNIYKTAPLHDIGKVGIPDYILLKPGKLTHVEFEVMKTHTIIGYHTLESIRKQYGEMDFLNMGIEITYCHHERYDGRGYPRGLKGYDIPLSAQILAISDVYDALTTERVYKSAYSHKEALEILKEERGHHFAPELFDIFWEISDEFNAIRRNFIETRTNQYLSI